MTKPKITVVEDNPDNLMLLKALLRKRYELTMYESGLQALEGMPEDLPAVVLLDISLPGMDGTEVLKRMRQHDALSGVPTIALTAHAMSGDREKYLSLGFDDYVSKPIVDKNVLYAAIDRLSPSSGMPEQALRDDIRRRYIGRLGSQLAQLLELRERLIAAPTDEDIIASLRQLGHKLLGSAGSFGLPEISDAAGVVEEAAVDALVPAIDRLAALLTRATGAA